MLVRPTPNEWSAGIKMGGTTSACRAEALAKARVVQILGAGQAPPLDRLRRAACRGGPTGCMPFFDAAFPSDGELLLTFL